MRLFSRICIGLLFTGTLFAILPLPFATESDLPEPMEASSTSRDPREIEGFFDLYSGSQIREMELPTFNNPPDSIGYDGGKPFETPPAMRKRVDFWKKIYSEYSSWQAVLHDTANLDLVYEVVDIKDIEANPLLSYRKKRRRINRRLRKSKRTIARNLLSLDSYRDQPINIPVELFTLFKKFEPIDYSDKFLAAAAGIRTQIGQRDRIVKGYFYGGRYFARMMKIFEEMKVPKELTRLTLVESAFNLKARSKVGASGVWQFIRSTGKRFMRINRFIDERNDPIIATRAAAKLLSHNYKLLNSWPLAVTAYNHGSGGMRRAVRELSTTSLPKIIKSYRSPTFGFASSNFYASFLAMLEIERDYRRYFGKLTVDAPLQFSELTLAKRVKWSALAEKCNITKKELETFNPGYTRYTRRNRRAIPVGYPIKLPPEKVPACQNLFAS